MTRRDDDRRRRRATAAVLRGTGAAIGRLRTDGGISQAALARAAGISGGHLHDIEHGRVDASTAVLVSIADALGADLSVRLYPNTGPRIHDRIQTRMVEALVRLLPATRWRAHLEVPVHRPARGYVDAVLEDRLRPLLVAAEAQSEFRRLEQQLRWANDKALSMPSTDLWQAVAGEVAIDRLLLLRSTAANRDLVDRLAATFATTYPVPARLLYAALSGDAEWPGPGILWARVEGAVGHILPTPPRGVRFGR